MTQTSPGSNQQVPREYLIELITKVSHVLPCFTTVNFRMDRVVKKPYFLVGFYPCPFLGKGQIGGKLSVKMAKTPVFETVI